MELWLVRHAETEWSLAKRHTGRTDIPLTDAGREHAARLAPLLAAHDFAAVLCSPLQRARETAELAGLGARTELRPALVEYDYGGYEGSTTEEIRETRPDWFLWRDGVPDGESPDDVGARVDAALARLPATIRAAPARRAPWTMDSPTPPQPTMQTLSPGDTSAAWNTAPAPVTTAQPRIAARSSGMSGSIRTHACSWTSIASA